MPIRKSVRLSARLLALCLAGHLAGCSHPARLDEWGGAQNCHFAHVTKAKFEAALRRVFEASGPKIYGLRPEEGGALVEQHWSLDVIFASGPNLERWRLEYAPAGDGIDVHAQVEHLAGKGFSSSGDQRTSESSDYELLWLRVQYVLGTRHDWPQCKASNFRRPGLCSNSVAPPLRLARSS